MTKGNTILIDQINTTIIKDEEEKKKKKKMLHVDGGSSSSTSFSFNEPDKLSNKEKKKLEYQKRIQKKKEKQLKKVQKLITKTQSGSLSYLKNNIVCSSVFNKLIDEKKKEKKNYIKNNYIENEAIRNKNNDVNVKNNDTNLNSDNINDTNIIYNNSNNKKNKKNKIKNMNMNKPDNSSESSYKEQKGKNDLYSPLENISKKKLIKKLKNKNKHAKEIEKKKLFKKIQEFKLNNTEQKNLMIPFDIKNIPKNTEHLDKLLKTYEELNIELPHYLNIIKKKIEKKRKRFLDKIEYLKEEKNVEQSESIKSQEIHCDIKKKNKINNLKEQSQSYIETNSTNEMYTDHYNSILKSESSDEDYKEMNHHGSYDDSDMDNENISSYHNSIKEKENDFNKHLNNNNNNNNNTCNNTCNNTYNNDKRKVCYKNIQVNRKKHIDKVRLSLPVLDYEQEIIEAVLNYDVVFVNGDTGCGKSTQVPQFLYEYGFTSNNYFIGITQPRKIAVKSICNRLNVELNGEICGYQIRFEKSHFLKHSKIKVMTEGILLKEIMSDFILSKYSVIILDEAHERSINMDIILGILSIISKIRKDNYYNFKSDIIPIKIIIMSATINDNNLFKNKIFQNFTTVNIPTQKVPVVDHFLSYTPKDYVEEAKRKIIQIHKKLPQGSILVFLTSQEEIYRLYNILSNLKINNLKFDEQGENKIMDEVNFDIFDLSEGEQNKDEQVSLFFRETDENKEKKILFDVSEEENSVDSDDTMIHNDINGNDVNGNDMNGNDMNGNDINGNDVNGNYMNGNDVNDCDINDGDINDSDKDINDNDKDINDNDKDINDNDKDINDNDKDINDSDKDINDSDKDINDNDKDINDNDKDINDSDNNINDSVNNINDSDNNINDSDKDINDNDNCNINNVYYNDIDDHNHIDDEPKNNINTYKLNNNTTKNSSIWKGSDGSGTLKVFKLYSNLPMKEQMQLFHNPKENERICILSTNIAETSLTLPNIRYVIDCGKEKRKIYSDINDYSYYIIDNISKCSAIQRKGRAGRILYLLKKNKKNKKKMENEKGHVYKLYSSNYYNYFFKNDNDYPILNYPLDSLILYLLSFNIRNVENFPFINKPDKSKFIEAKKRLLYLNCIHFVYKDIEFLFKKIDQKKCLKRSIENHIKKFNPYNKKGGITLTGSFILSLPISTRYAKILTDVCLKSIAMKQPNTIPLAALLVSCLYLESIFSYDYKLKMKYRKKINKNKNITFHDHKEEKKKNHNNLINLFLVKKKKNEKDTYTHSDDDNTLGSSNNDMSEEDIHNYKNNINVDVIENFKEQFDNDILFYLNICTKFYFSKDRNTTCQIMHLDKKKMNELLKLSNHLLKIINHKLNTNFSLDILEENISDISKNIIHYAVIQGFIDHLAIRSDLVHNEYTRNQNLSYNKKKAYITQNMNMPIYINSSSVLYHNRPFPKYILYNYITKNRNSYVMFDCLKINDSELGNITNVCIFINEYEKIPPAKYDKDNDKIIVYVKPLYLPSSHYLSITDKELNEKDFLFYNYFALFILDGSMFLKMTKFQIFYSHTTYDIINSAQENIKTFIEALKNARINNRSSLITKWKEDKDFLKDEFLSLIEKKFNKNQNDFFNNIWPPLD
ncbi:DEAD/DEAH box ATP-dependent RNA helicase, putative [Plasmodium sp. gorilla clade G3]|nr:DEAD/DEAH box ATP-dependent RNA helicase, putative [Plasmodium sp. gorilla clade G3]